jgi:hypothetical protein
LSAAGYPIHRVSPLAAKDSANWARDAKYSTVYKGKSKQTEVVLRGSNHAVNLGSYEHSAKFATGRKERAVLLTLLVLVPLLSGRICWRLRERAVAERLNLLGFAQEAVRCLSAKPSAVSARRTSQQSNLPPSVPCP